MKTIGISPDAQRLAGLSADLFHKLQHGGITFDELALFTQRRNPFAFTRNEHGHIVLTITGLDLAGEGEIEELVMGKKYVIALMPTAEIKDANERTTENLRNRGVQEYGYGKPLTGTIPRIREVVSDDQLEEMGVWFIAALYDTITDLGSGQGVLYSRRYGGGLHLSENWDRPDYRWRDDGALAFLVSDVSES